MIEYLQLDNIFKGNEKGQPESHRFWDEAKEMIVGIYEVFLPK